MSEVHTAYAAGPAPITIRLALPLPPSANNLYFTAGGHRVKSGAAKSYGWLVFAETVGMPDALAGPLRLTVTITLPNRKRRDLDNTLKVLGDALAERFRFDDSAVTEIHAYKRLERGISRCDVTLEEVDGDH